MTAEANRVVHWVTIGQITAPHGVRGEVRIRPLTDFPQRFEGMERVHLFLDGRRWQAEIECIRPHARGNWTMKLNGVDTREEAEGLRRAELQVPPHDTYPLPEGEYYVFELVGCSITTGDGKDIGLLIDVITTGANDVYLVENDQGNQFLIPAIKQVVKEIDLDGRRILIDPIPGLLDER